MSFSPGDYYRRLRLPRNASRREIKAAFRRLARQYHPDLHPNQPGATVRFQALQEAYEVLIDRVQRQRYDQSQQGFGSKHSADPLTPSDFYIRGVRYLLASRYRAALSDYTRAIRLDDQFAEAYLRRAEVRYELEDDSGVLSDCQQAIALNSVEAKTYYFQGLARYRLGYVQSAIAAFTDAITCDPDDAQYYYRRGLAHQDLGELHEAAKDLRRAAGLYREQGDLVNYQRLQVYLKPFGTAGRSRPVRLLGGIAQRLSALLPGRSRQRSSRLAQPDSSAQRPPTHPKRSTAPRRTDYQRRWPLAPSSEQTRWARGVSSRPGPHEPIARRAWPLSSVLVASLRLLSNPAGEMVPLYQQLSSRQAHVVGYALAVLANLAFVLGTMAHLPGYLPGQPWLVASQLWAAGGLMYVAMVMIVAIARVGWRICSLWVADIFVLGTALVPLGMLAAASAIAPILLGQIGLPPKVWMAHIWVSAAVLAIAVLWALSHTLLTLYSGLTKIHAFPERISAWFAPAVLALGIAAGTATWVALTLKV